MASFPSKLNEQVGHEFAASQQYVAIAVYYDAETLPLLAAHFYRQAVEERNHAMMIVQFMLDADHDVEIPAAEAPQTKFSDARAPVALALEQEKRVTEQIASARRPGPRGERPRRRAVPALVPAGAARGGREHVRPPEDRRARLGVNILLVEDYLSRNTVGDQGESAAAPPAAGGAL